MKLLIVEVFLLALLMVPTKLSADPITPRPITAGQLFDTGHFEVFGPGFDLRGVEEITPHGCQPCIAGGAGSDSAIINLGEVRDLSGTVDGVTYPHLFISGFNPGSVSGIGAFIIPPDTQTGTVFTFPFGTADFDHLIGFTSADDATLLINPAFSFPIVGRGTATMTLNRVESDGKTIFFPQNVTFTFGSGASPTPEPASVLLVGTGVSAILVRRMRRPHARQRNTH